MHQYTHAWIAFMAIKRLETANLGSKTRRLAADQLVAWFKEHRDSVIKGAWYPDKVFKDMGTSHIVKYQPVDADKSAPKVTFRSLPKTNEMCALGKKNEKLYEKPYKILDGNCCDRVEAFAHSIIDCLKIQLYEEKGDSIVPSSNYIAMRFFIMSHYIADCHMPLHCDCRPFSDGKEIHAYIEDRWEEQVLKSYFLDSANDRFFYDRDGYPLKTDNVTDMIRQCEENASLRPYVHSWGLDNDNTWDYMSSVSQYSYLTSYFLLPEDQVPKDIKDFTREQFDQTEFGKNFDEYSRMILCDAIDSVARIWLHVWLRYKKNSKQLLNAQDKEEEKALKKGVTTPQQALREALEAMSKEDNSI